jgi:dihydropteroate synthase
MLTGDRRPLAGTLAAQFFALEQGASILRVHDTSQALDIVNSGRLLRRTTDFLMSSLIQGL